jgi:hypothetical protein
MRSPDGTPVDEKIKPLIIGLRRWRVRTLMSCQGHSEKGRGFPYPWVDVALKDAKKIVKLLRLWNIDRLQKHQEAKLWIIKPYAGFLMIMPENPESRELAEMQEEALKFGKFLQELPRI